MYVFIHSDCGEAGIKLMASSSIASWPELLSMTAGVEMGCWFTSADQVNGDVLLVWDGVRRELITFSLQPAEREML